ANILTGWTLVPPGDNPEHGGEFTFNPRLHEPGAQKVLGKSYDDETVEQGRAVLRDLAANPATAVHVATKLARHFIADAPPSALVERMAKVFIDTEGDLKQVARTMVLSDEAWTPPATKLKRPSEWVVGMVRATGLTQADPARFTDGQALLGEPLWRPPSPKGFPDDEGSWIDGMGRRLDVANNFAERVTGRVDLRGERALVLDGKPPALPLDSFFALNPAMPNLHRLYKAQQAAIVHATATPYRERSHFDGQDVLESGVARPGAVDTGWLNR